MEKEKKIKVLILTPGSNPVRTAIPNTLKAFQGIVGGNIEVLPFTNDTVLICNEEGKLLGLPRNIRNLGNPADVIVGTVIVAGYTEGEHLCSVPDGSLADTEDVLRRCAV